MEDIIKVLHVGATMDRGGTETLVMNLLRVLDRDRLQIDIVEQTQRRCDYDDEIEALGTRIYRCPTISPRNLRQYRMWWRQFFQEHPEYRIVHGHSRGSAPIYLNEAHRAGRVTILHCHSNSYVKGLAGVVRCIWQIPLHWIADYNFACSYEAGVSQFGKKRPFRVINNGIVSKDFSWSPQTRKALRSELNLEDSFVIGNVGRFETPKNHPFLIDIFSEVKKIIPHAKLMLIGIGTHEEMIKEKARQMGISDDVLFMGLRSDVCRLHQAMDAFVFPSLYEGMPLALVEAQAASLPCFVSDTVSKDVKVTDLVQFISLKDPAGAWAKQIADAMQNAPERKDRSEEIAQAGFDIRSTAEELERFYREVLSHD